MILTSATRFVWAVPVVGAVAVILVAAGLLDLGPLGGIGLGDESVYAVTVGLAFGCVGAIIATRHSHNAIGWLCCGLGLASAVSGSSAVFSELSMFNQAWGVWIATWSGFFIYISVPLMLLLFPDGKPLSRQWRAVVWSAALAATVVQLRNVFGPGLLEDSDVVNPAGIESLRFLLRNPWLIWGAWILLGYPRGRGR